MLVKGESKVVECANAAQQASSLSSYSDFYSCPCPICINALSLKTLPEANSRSCKVEAERRSIIISTLTTLLSVSFESNIEYLSSHFFRQPGRITIWYGNQSPRQFKFRRYMNVSWYVYLSCISLMYFYLHGI